MTNHFTSKVSTFTCIDLLNTSLIDLNNLFIINNINPMTEEYIKHIYESLPQGLSEDHSQHIIYLHNSYIIGSRDLLNKDYEFSLGGFELLPKLEKRNYCADEIANLIRKFEHKKSLILDTSLTANDKKVTSQLLKNDEFDFTNNEFDFTNDEFDFSNNEFDFINGYLPMPNNYNLNDLKTKYNIVVQFLDAKENEDLADLTLQEIYYIDNLPLIFIFKANEGEKILGWNMQFLEALKSLNPINQNKPSEPQTLNKILDKINNLGIAFLSKDDLHFLANY
jgi:hypothetical protein